ncbi:hypothetical protein N9996_02415 [Synechococcus sp. AH-603-M21]|nr:hypothetical protein [Synechococcus sp. AH-603-M21]
MIQDWGNSSMLELSDWQWAIGAGVVVASLIVGGWLNRQQDAPEDSEPNDPPLCDQHNELDEPHQQLEARDIELRDIRKQLQARNAELKEAQGEAELVLLQLHQVQEELEDIFLQNQTLKGELNELKEVRQQLKARDNELNELKDVRQQLQARDAELKEAQEEAELTLLQLHQVQEELEYYFLENRKLAKSQDLAPKQLEQLQRIKQRLIQQLKASPTKEHPALTQIVRRQQNALRRFQRLHQTH